MVATVVGDVNLGERLRELRVAAGLSVRTLAATTEFSPSFISQVEHGLASPSIASLERIAHALGVSLVEFFERAEPASAVVTRAGSGAPLVSTWSRARVHALGPTGEGVRLGALMISLEPGGRSGKLPEAHPGEEFAVVYEGEVVLTLGAEEHRLGRGDSASFSSTTPHLWENRGVETARLVAVSSRASR